MNSLSRTQKPRAGFTPAGSDGGDCYSWRPWQVWWCLTCWATKRKPIGKKAISDIVALENALDMYRLDNGRYPTTEQGLEALIQQPANMADSRNYRTGGYIKRLPKDPWGNDYQYLSPGEKRAV